MANIRIKCPTCESELEVDETFDGQDVECGSCGRVFVARSRPPSAPPSARPSSRREEPRDRPKHDDREDREDRRSRRDRDREDRDDRDDRDDDEREDRRPARRSRRPRPRDEDENEEEGRGYEPPSLEDYEDYADSAGAEHSNVYNNLALTSLVLGVIDVALVLLTLPFACCCAFLPLPLTVPLSLAAVGTGAFGLKGDSDRKPLAAVGLVLGALCLVFAALQIAFEIIPPMGNPGR